MQNDTFCISLAQLLAHQKEVVSVHQLLTIRSQAFKSNVKSTHPYKNSDCMISMAKSTKKQTSFMLVQEYYSSHTRSNLLKSFVNHQNWKITTLRGKSGFFRKKNIRHNFYSGCGQNQRLCGVDVPHFYVMGSFIKFTQCSPMLISIRVWPSELTFNSQQSSLCTFVVSPAGLTLIANSSLCLQIFNSFSLLINSLKCQCSNFSSEMLVMLF